MANTACAKRDSTELKKGSPKPIGKPSTVHSIIPPTVSFASIAFCKPFSTSVSPPICKSVAFIFIEANIFFATTPAATKQTVRRPLKCPLPL